jgi:hypothetical protein
MAEAFQRQVIFGGALDSTLLEMGLVEEPVVIEYLGRASGMPTTDEEPGPEARAEAERGFNGQRCAARASGWW